MQGTWVSSPVWADPLSWEWLSTCTTTRESPNAAAKTQHGQKQENKQILKKKKKSARGSSPNTLFWITRRREQRSFNSGTSTEVQCLRLQEARVRSLVRELRSHMLWGAANKWKQASVLHATKLASCRTEVFKLVWVSGLLWRWSWVCYTWNCLTQIGTWAHVLVFEPRQNPPWDLNPWSFN